MKKFIFLVLLTIGVVGVWTVTVQAQAPRKKTDLTAEDRLAWYNFLKWPEEYKDLLNAWSDSDGGLYFDKLNPHKYLVTIQVAMPGGHQTGYVFTIYDESNPPKNRSKLLRFKCLYLDSNDGKPTLMRVYEEQVWGNIEFDPKRKIFRVLSTSRGLGDCGTLIYYKLINDKPVIIEARARHCDDSTLDNFPPPEKWKRVRNP